MPKRSSRLRTLKPRKRPTAEPCLYLGCFIFDEPGEPDRTGSFQVVVEADSPDQAAERCKARLRKLRTSTTLFDSPTTILLDGLIRLSGSFERGVLVNFQVGDTPPPPNAIIGCLIPEQTDHEAQDFALVRKKKKTKLGIEEEEEPFLDFGGEGLRRAIEVATQGTTTRGAGEATAARSVGPLIPTAPAKAAAPRRSKEEAQAEVQAKKAMRTALAATLDEMRATGGKGRERGKRA